MLAVRLRSTMSTASIVSGPRRLVLHAGRQRPAEVLGCVIRSSCGALGLGGSVIGVMLLTHVHSGHVGSAERPGSKRPPARLSALRSLVIRQLPGAPSALDSMPLSLS